jgi:nucleoside-diphosphate-sugar epimerase
VPVVILRVPGIYGPRYLPEERLRSGEPVLREDESPFSNRIHADDLARVCVVAAHHVHPRLLYNVSDGHPTTMTDFFYRVADVLGIPRPPMVTMEEARRRLGEGMLSYLAESKRIDSRRMREELGVELMYPDLTAGLASCFERCG